MNFTGVLIVLSAAVFVLLLWVIVGVRNLRRLRKSIEQQWEEVGELLRRRQDVLPNLVETVRRGSDKQEKLIGKLIAQRVKAAKEEIPGAKKIEYEHDLSRTINKVIDLGRMYEGLYRDVNFLELKSEISELGEGAEAKAEKYNEMVRYYNKHRDFFVLWPIAVVFRYGRENIFEFEK